MINASDEELEKSIESCERWEWFGGGLVVAGVIGTVAIAIVHPQYDSFLEQWGSAIADGFVAVGVGIEIKFGQMAGLRQSELKRRSNEKVSASVMLAASANERASIASKRAEELRVDNLSLQASLRPRRFSFKGWTTGDPKQIAAIYEGLKAHSGSVVLIQPVHDFEAQLFARDIASTLAESGWQARLVTQYESHFPDLALTEGVWIFQLTEAAGLASTALYVALGDALQRMGMHHSDMPFHQTLASQMPLPSPRFDPPIDAVFVRVGLKSSSSLDELRQREFLREGEEYEAALTNHVRAGGELKCSATDGTIVDAVIGPNGKLVSADPNKKLALPDRHPTLILPGGTMIRAAPFPNETPKTPAPEIPQKPRESST